MIESILRINSIDVQIKRDASGNSKGFGFIRYEDYSSQAKALGQRHYVNNRWVEVKIPASKVIFFKYSHELEYINFNCVNTLSIYTTSLFRFHIFFESI